MRLLPHSLCQTRRLHGSLRATSAVVLVAAVAALVGGSGPPARAQMPAGIIAGESIGPARLGMTDNQLAALLGPSTADGPARRVYPQYGVAIDFRGGVAVRIATSAATYRTVAGAGVGNGPQDTARFVGDINSVTTVSGHDTTIWYEFQGIGFVFRGGRAVEAFVLEPVPFGNRPAAGAPGSPQVPPSAVQQPSATTAPAAPGALFRDVKASVEPGGGLAITGTVVNTGSALPGPLTVTGLFTRSSGAQVESRTQIQGPLAPGASASFSLQAAMVGDLILRYQLNVTNAAGAMLAATQVENVPSSAYEDFARQQMHIKVEFGAPSTGVGPASVQALISVVDTGVIPTQWVQQINVQVPYRANGNSGVQNADLRPGQKLTVLIPAGATVGAPLVTGVVLGGG
jgi:hypothetical protein